jgi:predicted transcriptional regulator
MKVCELVDLLKLKVYSGHDGLEKTITGGYTSDLLSDVMGNVDEGNVWITLQTHKNVMAIASLKDVAAVIVVKGFQPGEETINQSNIEGIPLLGTNLETYEITGKLYKLLN